MANPFSRWGASGVWRGRCAHCSRARTPCCSKCASRRRTAARYGRAAWRGQEWGGRMCSYWITSPRQDQGRSPCGPFSACRAGGCSATGKGQEAGAWAAWHRCRGWPYVRNTGLCPVPPAGSGEPNTAANGHTKGTAWTRRKRCGRGSSPHSRQGPAPWRRPRPRGARPARANAPARDLPHQHSGWGGNEQGNHGALCRPCVMSTGPRRASHAGGIGGCGTVVAATEGHPRVLGGVNGVCRLRGGGGCSNNWALCPSEGRSAHRHPLPGEGVGV